MTFQIPFCRPLLISLDFFLAAATCLPASAGDQLVNQGPRTTVKFGDLDLSTDAGRRELLERLSKAAGRVCEDYANANWSLGYDQVYSSCFRSSLAAAVEKIHHEQVSALFAATSLPNTP
jgi:UrcA family protein